MPFDNWKEKVCSFSLHPVHVAVRSNLAGSETARFLRGRVHPSCPPTPSHAYALSLSPLAALQHPFHPFRVYLKAFKGALQSQVLFAGYTMVLAYYLLVK